MHFKTRIAKFALTDLPVPVVLARVVLYFRAFTWNLHKQGVSKPQS